VANSAPNVPSNLAPDGVLAKTASHFTGNFTDPDPNDRLTQVRIEILQQVEGVWTLIWSTTTEVTASERDASAFSVPIPGQVKSLTDYVWTASVADQLGAWSPVSNYIFFRQPNASPSVVLRPLFSEQSMAGVRFRGEFSDPDPQDQLGSLRIQLLPLTPNGDPAWESDALLWDTGWIPALAPEVTNSEFDRPYSGAPLAAGDYSWRAAVRDGRGASSAWAYGSISILSDWTDDPDAIDFTSGFRDKHPPVRVVLRNLGPNRAPGSITAIIEDAANIGASLYHNSPGEFYMTLPGNHQQLGAIEPWRTHYAVQIWIAGSWQERFNGLITDFDATDNDIVIYGVDYLGMFEKIIDSRFVAGKPDLSYASGGSKYSDVSLSAILLDQVKQAVAKLYGPLHFLKIDTATWPSWAEKASIWTTYANHLSTITGLIESHRAGTGVRTRFSVDGSGSTFTARLRNNAGSQRANLKMEYGGLVQGFRLTAFGDFSTRVYGIGRSTTGLKPFYSNAPTPGLKADQWGQLETARVWPDVYDQNDLNRRTKQAASTVGRIGKRVALGLRVDTLLPLDGYNICDWLPVHIKRGAIDTTRYGSGWWVIEGVEFKVYPDGHMENTLVLLPLESPTAPNLDLLPAQEIFPGSEWKIGYQPPGPSESEAKLYLDLNTGITYEQQPDGSWTVLDNPNALAAPTGLSLSSSQQLQVDGTTVSMLTASLTQPVGDGLLGSFVQITDITDNNPTNPVPQWDNPISLFIPADGTQASHDGVAGGTEYYARAASETNWGQTSAWTLPVSTRASVDSTAPSTPTSLKASGAVKALIAEWDVSEARDLKFYEIRFAPDAGAGSGPGADPSWTIYRARTNAIYIGGLLPEIRYWVQVRAVDATGNVEDQGPPISAMDFITHPETGWCAQVSADTTLVGGDDILPGSITFEHIVASGLDAAVITGGTLRINTSDTSMMDGIWVYGPGGTVVGRWDETGLYIYDETDSGDYLQIEGGGISIYRDGVPTTTITPDGINASAINFGALPGGGNMIPNSSFELAGFTSVVAANLWTLAADWTASQVSTTNLTTGASTLTITNLAF